MKKEISGCLILFILSPLIVISFFILFIVNTILYLKDVINDYFNYEVRYYPPPKKKRIRVKEKIIEARKI